MARLLPTMARAGAALAGGEAQRRRLAERLAELPDERAFERSLAGSALWPLRATGIGTLQINVGKRCNQTCRHCHVDAGPDRREVMPREVIEACLGFLERERIPTFDVTGGAPELHADFREIVVRGARTGAHVIHRCNLTAILLPNYADIPALLAEHRVEVCASLPYFGARETDAQRGDGVFEQSIEGLRVLNALGYGAGGGLALNLVTNPVGTFLPGSQRDLEAYWKREMSRRFGIVFDSLYTITNVPVSRFLEFLEERGTTADYLARLVSAYNPGAAAGVMCRTTLSVGWDGTLHDCDFNQMLELPLARGAPRTIFDAERAALANREIVVGPHCYACTAGAGSSCGGATA